MRGATIDEALRAAGLGRYLDAGKAEILPSGPVLCATRTDGSSEPPFGQPPFPDDCGLDLATTEDVLLRPGETANIPCGVAVALPGGTFGLITGRSSTWTKWGLWVYAGIIDEGWRGELRTLVYRPFRSTLEPTAINIPRGTRLAQLIVLPNLLSQVRIVNVDELPPGSRELKGFGSSG
jgi:dUTP pyrophosphatase